MATAKTTTRRVRVQRRKLSDQKNTEDMKVLEEGMERYMQLDRQINKAVDEQKRILENALPLMRKLGLTQHDTKSAHADVVTPKGRSSTLIHVGPFIEAMEDRGNSEEVIHGCLKVQVTQAKGYLGEKEINKISTVTDGKDGEPCVTIKARKEK